MPFESVFSKSNCTLIASNEIKSMQVKVKAIKCCRLKLDDYVEYMGMTIRILSRARDYV